ncbi:hypothetical protein BDZ97DRAFT_1834551 [Flammula alnicola]|nr:hypothetical protein BDZ97DRAFT_1834551 [Flammula alnicola]
MTKVLEVLSRAMLESFTLKAQMGFLTWEIKNDDSHRRTPILLAMCSNPSLKSLHISNFLDFPQSLIIAVVYSPNITVLSLADLSIEASDGDTRQNSRGRHSRIETLELGRLPYSYFFSALRPTTSSQSASEAFPHLRSLSIVVPSDRDDDLSDFILGVAHSLETLALEHITLRAAYPTFLDLAPFTSLRILKLGITATGDLEVRFTLAGIVNFLASAMHPSPIELVAIKITTAQEIGLSKRDALFMRWNALDEVLTSPAFVNLSRLDLQFVIARFREAPRFGDDMSRPYLNVRAQLPLVCARTSISLSVSLEVPFSRVLVFSI